MVLYFNGRKSEELNMKCYFRSKDVRINLVWYSIICDYLQWTGCRTRYSRLVCWISDYEDICLMAVCQESLMEQLLAPSKKSPVIGVRKTFGRSPARITSSPLLFPDASCPGHVLVPSKTFNLFLAVVIKLVVYMVLLACLMRLEAVRIHWPHYKYRRILSV